MSVNNALASCSAERLKSASVKSVLNARGGIRTHVGLRQRILSPPPCLRLFSGRLFRPGSGTLAAGINVHIATQFKSFVKSRDHEYLNSR